MSQGGVFNRWFRLFRGPFEWSRCDDRRTKLRQIDVVLESYLWVTMAGVKKAETWVISFDVGGASASNPAKGSVSDA